MKATPLSEKDRNRIPKLHAAFAASSQLQTMFASRDAFVNHMLKAEYDSDEAISAEFPTVGSFVAYSKRAWKQG